MMIKIIAVSNVNVTYIDANGINRKVTRDKFMSLVQSGEIQLNITQLREIKKERDTRGRIVAYITQDMEGNIKRYSADDLKRAIRFFEVDCVNLRLTSNGRLVDKNYLKNAVSCTDIKL